MDSFIMIDGIALWIFCALIVLIVICLIAVFYKYAEALKEHEYIARELDAVNEDNNCLRCQLNAANKKIYTLTYKTPEVE